jgi:hypothetical protein
MDQFGFVFKVDPKSNVRLQDGSAYALRDVLRQKAPTASLTSTDKTGLCRGTLCCLLWRHEIKTIKVGGIDVLDVMRHRLPLRPSAQVFEVSQDTGQAAGDHHEDGFDGGNLVIKSRELG